MKLYKIYDRKTTTDFSTYKEYAFKKCGIKIFVTHENIVIEPVKENIKPYRLRLRKLIGNC